MLHLGPPFPQKRLRRVHGVQGRHEPVEGFRAHRALLGGHRPHTRLATPGLRRGRTVGAAQQLGAGAVQGRQHRAHERLPVRRLRPEAQGYALRVPRHRSVRQVWGRGGDRVLRLPALLRVGGHARHHQAGDRTHGGMVALRGGGDNPVRGGRGPVRARGASRLLPCSHEAETGREEGPWRQTGGARGEP